MARRQPISTGSGSGSEYEDDEQGTELQVYSKLSTRLRWEVPAKQMHVLVRQHLVTKNSMEVSLKGQFNNVTGVVGYSGAIRRGFVTNEPTYQRLFKAVLDRTQSGRQDYELNRFLPGGLQGLILTDWIISPGVHLPEAGKNLQYSLRMSKAPQMVKRFGNFDAWLTAKGDLHVDTHTHELSQSANVRLNCHSFSSRLGTELQVSVGADFAPGPEGVKTDAYLKVEERKWAVRYKKGLWAFTYKI